VTVLRAVVRDGPDATVTAGTSAARDQAKVRLLSAAVTELANA
jgi:hypothetical protein